MRAVERPTPARAGAGSGSSPEAGSGPGGGSEPWSTPAGRRVEVSSPSVHRGVGDPEVHLTAAEAEDPVPGASPNARSTVDRAGGVTDRSLDDAPVGRTAEAEPRAGGRPLSAHWGAAADGVTERSPYGSPADPAPAARARGMDTTTGGRPRSRTVRAEADGEALYAPPPAAEPLMATRGLDELVRRWEGLAPHASPERGARHDAAGHADAPSRGGAAALTAEDIADALDELVRREAQRHGLDGGTP
jgi:hypothetical protein